MFTGRRTPELRIKYYKEFNCRCIGSLAFLVTLHAEYCDSHVDGQSIRDHQLIFIVKTINAVSLSAIPLPFLIAERPPVLRGASRRLLPPNAAPRRLRLCVCVSQVSSAAAWHSRLHKHYHYNRYTFHYSGSQSHNRLPGQLGA